MLLLAVADGTGHWKNAVRARILG